MSEVSPEKKFECRIPINLWERYESWQQGRPRSSNPELMIGLLRLFLQMPRDVQLKALKGTEEELVEELRNQGLHRQQAAWKQGAIEGQDLILDAQRDHPVQAIEQLVRLADPQTIQLLSPIASRTFRQ